MQLFEIKVCKNLPIYKILQYAAKFSNYGLVKPSTTNPGHVLLF